MCERCDRLAVDFIIGFQPSVKRERPSDRIREASRRTITDSDRLPGHTWSHLPPLSASGEELP
jgi:hypothetical protein